MFLASLGRILGVLLAVGAAILTLVAFANRSTSAGVVSALMAIAGFAISWASNRRAKRLRATRDLAQAAALPEFHGKELTVRPNLFKLVLFVFGATALAVMMLLVCVATWGSGGVVTAVMMAAAGSIFLWFAAAFSRVAMAAWDAGFLLQLDMRGLAHCMLPQIPWRHVQGIDLEEVEVKNQKSWHLKLGIDRSFIESIRPSPLRRWFDSAAPRFDMKRQVITIPLVFGDIDPAQLTAAARSIADKAGARRVPDWSHYEDVPAALARAAARERVQEAQDESERLFARLQSVKGQPSVGTDELRKIETRVAASIEEMKSASNQELELIAAQMGKRSKQAARSLYVMLGVVVLVGMLQLALKFL